MKKHHLRLPIAEAEVRKLEVGDTVTLDGELVVMAGNPTFQRSVSILKSGGKLPVKLENSIIFNCPTYHRTIRGKHVLPYVGITSSLRFEAFFPYLIEHGLRAVIGKGGLGKDSARAMIENGCVYLSVTGASGPLLAEGITAITSVHWRDLDRQNQLMTFSVKNFGPTTVTMDTKGNSLYDKMNSEVRSRLPGILQQLRERRPDFMR